eukprot:Skav204030  [mRNA]  locus=scaffold1162:24139:47383:+ [translate_table: standard]
MERSPEDYYELDGMIDDFNPYYLLCAYRGVLEPACVWSARNEVIEAMTSGEGETVDFTNKVDVMKPGNVGAVECWLVEVEESMMDILREVTDKSNKAYPSADRVKWCCEWPGQVVLATEPRHASTMDPCSDMIFWTQEVTQALKSANIAEYEKQLVGQMTKLNRVTVGAMVTLDVHARDEVTNLVQKRVDSPDDFAWLSQLRYYWQERSIYSKHVSLQALRLNMPYIRDLENCIQFGTPVLLENVEESLDAILDPVLQKATFKQGTLTMVRLGDSTIEWFGLLLLPLPGNILDDEELIETLSSSKIMGTKIEEQVKQQEITAVQIAEVRQVYKYHALRCAALYFIICDLCIVDPMMAEPKESKEERFTELFNSFIRPALRLLFIMVCRGLFEKDKLLYSVMLTLKCQEMEKELKLNEVMALLTGLPGPAKEEKPADSGALQFLSYPNPPFRPKSHHRTPPNDQQPRCRAIGWLTTVSWNRINQLMSLGDVFDGFVGEFSANVKLWQDAPREVFDSDTPADVEWPNNFKLKCSPMQRALLLFALRPDSTVGALMTVVQEPVCYKDSTPSIPLIYILASGSDPMADIQKLAETLDMLAKINPISLGQGQGPKVLLQNCHLAPSFMPTLESIAGA